MRDKGITLIALVVTIIVLLILAGFTIGALTSDNGVIKEATTAKEKAEKAGVEEQIEMAILEAEKKYRNPTLDNIIDQLKEDKIINNEDDVNRITGEITTTSGYEIEGKLDDYTDKEISPYGLGDINGDGVIDDTDLSLLQGYLAESITLTDEEKLRADVNKDGRINVSDATDIQEYIKDRLTIGPHELGDINDDGVIDDTDLSLIRSYLSDSITFTDEQKLRADVNKDGRITIDDATDIQKYRQNTLSIGPHELGDINDDGVIDDTDLSLIRSYLSDSITFTDEQKLRADVNKDGRITIDDATDIQKYIIG